MNAGLQQSRMDDGVDESRKFKDWSLNGRLAGSRVKVRTRRREEDEDAADDVPGRTASSAWFIYLARCHP